MKVRLSPITTRGIPYSRMAPVHTPGADHPPIDDKHGADRHAALVPPDARLLDRQCQVRVVLGHLHRSILAVGPSRSALVACRSRTAAVHRPRTLASAAGR
jgi:hypothetical protein